MKKIVQTTKMYAGWRDLSLFLCKYILNIAFIILQSVVFEQLTYHLRIRKVAPAYTISTQDRRWVNIIKDGNGQLAKSVDLINVLGIL